MGVEWHVIRRLRERYGLEMTKGQVRKLVDRIRCRDSLLLRRQEDGTEVHAIRYHGQVLKLVYCPVTSILITALPTEREPEYRSKKVRQAARRKRDRRKS